MNALEIERNAADWLVKRTGGSWSKQEQAEFDAWIDANLAHRIAYLRIEAVWNETGRLQALSPGAPPNTTPARGAWLDTGSLPIGNSSRQPDETPSVHSPRRRMAALAAGFMALLFTTGLIGYLLWPTGGQYTTDVGAIDTVALTDGSRITLNTDTHLRVAIKPYERLMELDKGEAYFEVAKDPARPFVVDAGTSRIVAVGTKFSVRRDANDIQMVVTEGSVRVEGRERGDTVTFISAGTIARARAGTVIARNEPMNQIENHLSWRRGYLVFRDTPLAEAVAEFNRYNRRKIVIEDPRIADLRVGGNFKSDSVDVFLWMLRNAFPVEVDEAGKEVVLRSR